MVGPYFIFSSHNKIVGLFLINDTRKLLQMFDALCHRLETRPAVCN